MYCEAQALSLSINYTALYREVFLICSLSALIWSAQNNKNTCVFKDIQLSQDLSKEVSTLNIINFTKPWFRAEQLY